MGMFSGSKEGENGKLKKNTSVLESFLLKTKRNMDSNGGPIFEVSSFFSLMRNI